MRISLNKFLLWASGLVLLPAISNAADTEKPGGLYDTSPVLIGLLGLFVLLLWVIYALGKVLRQLSITYRDKIISERTSARDAAKAILLLLAFSALSLPAFAAEETAAAPAEFASGVVAGIPEFDFYLLLSLIGFEMLVIFAMLISIRLVIRSLNYKPEAMAIVKAARIPFWDRFNKAVAIEKEQDVMLDHDYDGIRELDNSLPPWWIYGFYITIIFSVIYLWRFHVSGTGPSSTDEYAIEMKQAEEEKAAYLAQAANNIDENNVALITDAAELEAGKALFQSTCAACHAADGGGTVGPNLTDEYWLHGGSIQSIFKSIKYGWQDKGMKSWKDDFSPKQIAQLSSFIHSLKGTHPAAPKEKQGELYVEAASSAPVVADSAAKQ